MVGLSGVRFSPFRPLVFAVATTDGTIFIFDLKENMSMPVVTLSLSQANNAPEDDKKRNASAAKSSNVPLIGLAFNHKQRDLLSACDWYGRVHIWKLSWKLCNKQNDEQQLLDDLGRIASGEEKDV